MAFIAADIREQIKDVNNKGYICLCGQRKQKSSCLFSGVYLNPK